MADSRLAALLKSSCTEAAAAAESELSPPAACDAPAPTAAPAGVQSDAPLDEAIGAGRVRSDDGAC
jgi:hypothetical protein